MAEKETNSNEEPNAGGRRLLMLLPKDTNPCKEHIYQTPRIVSKEPWMRYAISRPTNLLSSRADDIATNLCVRASRECEPRYSAFLFFHCLPIHMGAEYRHRQAPRVIRRHCLSVRSRCSKFLADFCPFSTLPLARIRSREDLWPLFQAVHQSRPLWRSVGYSVGAGVEQTQLRSCTYDRSKRRLLRSMCCSTSSGFVRVRLLMIKIYLMWSMCCSAPSGFARVRLLMVRSYMARFPKKKHLYKLRSLHRYQSGMAALPTRCHTTIDRAPMHRWCLWVDTSRANTRYSAKLSFDLSVNVDF